MLSNKINSTRKDRVKIIFFELTNDEKAYFQNHLIDDHVTYFTEALTEATNITTRDADILSIKLHSHITQKVLEQFPCLKLIITRSTGMDHIDLKAAQQKNILVISCPLYATESVAEHTFALLLMLAKKMRKSCCSPSMFLEPVESLKGFELAHKTLGIIGFGNIGKAVARIANAFFMKIIVHDDLQRKFSNNAFTFVDLKTVYSQADVLSFHVPLTQDTHHLLTLKSLPLLKKGVIILNTSRGEIIETEALLKGIEDGIIAQAGLDVLEEEDLTRNPLDPKNETTMDNKKYKIIVQNYALINHPNVIVTCHNAYNTNESFQRMVDQTIKIIEAFKKRP